MYQKNRNYSFRKFNIFIRTIQITNTYMPKVTSKVQLSNIMIYQIAHLHFSNNGTKSIQNNLNAMNLKSDQLQTIICTNHQMMSSLISNKSMIDKQINAIVNKYTQEYQQFLKIPQSDRLHYNTRIHQIPMEESDLELPTCTPTYFSKIPAAKQTHINLTTYVWETKQQPKNILFLNHGLNGNISSYQHLAESVSKNSPTIVIGHDARHFGRSDGIPRGLVNNPQRLVEDLEKVIQWGTKKYGEKLNVFLLGLSMGGRVVVEVAVRKKFNYRGAILVVPALVLSPISTLKLGFKEYFKIVFMPQSGICLPNYTYGCRHSQFINSKVKPDQYIYQGPLLAGTVRSLGLFSRSSKEVSQKFDCPYLFIQAGVDKLIDPFQVRDFCEWSKSSDKTHYFSKQMWHSCCFDAQFLVMAPEIVRWINDRTD